MGREAEHVRARRGRPRGRRGRARRGASRPPRSRSRAASAVAESREQVRAQEDRAGAVERVRERRRVLGAAARASASASQSGSEKRSASVAGRRPRRRERARAAAPRASSASSRPPRSRRSAASRRRGGGGGAPSCARSRRRQSATPSTASAAAARAAPRRARGRRPQERARARRRRRRRRATAASGTSSAGARPRSASHAHRRDAGLRGRRRRAGAAAAAAGTGCAASTRATSARSASGSNGFSMRGFGTRARNSRAPAVKAPPVRKTVRSASAGATLAQPRVELHPGHVRHHEVAEERGRTAPRRRSRPRAPRARSCASTTSCSGARIRLTARPTSGSSSTTRIRPRRAAGSPRARPGPAAPRAPRARRGAGRSTRNVEPFPGVDSTWISPPRPLTMPWQIERPSPVPTPTGFVVKNGSKMRGRTSGGMPAPVSEISTRARPSGAVPVDGAHDVLAGAPLRDRLRGVDEEVQEHLAEPVLAPDDGRDLARRPPRAARGAGSRSGRGRAPTGARAAGRPRSRALPVGARERLQVAHDLPDAQAAVARLVERAQHLGVGRPSPRSSAERELEVREDERERVVDLVRDARGERARPRPSGRRA